MTMRGSVAGEARFAERYVSNVQITLARPACRVTTALPSDSEPRVPHDVDV